MANINVFESQWDDFDFGTQRMVSFLDRSIRVDKLGGRLDLQYACWQATRRDLKFLEHDVFSFARSETLHDCRILG